MENRVSINDLIGQHYEGLSPRLKLAADYVVSNLDDVASRSLRAVASGSGLNPPTYSRLAKALGLPSHETLRELCRNEIKDRGVSYAEKASLLRESRIRGANEASTPFAIRQSSSAIRNIDAQAQDIDIKQLRALADQLVDAKRVFVAGSMASNGIAQYLVYLASLAFTNWQIIGRHGVSMTTALTGVNENDVLLIIMKSPYARRSVDAAHMAHDSGAHVAVISDSIFVRHSGLHRRLSSFRQKVRSSSHPTRRHSCCWNHSWGW